MNKTKGAHFNSFDTRHDFPLLPTDDEAALAALDPNYVAPFDYNLVYNSSDIALLFNTSGSPTLTITNTSCVTGKAANPLVYANATCIVKVAGYMRVSAPNGTIDVLTDYPGTETGLFNFRSIYIGASVSVTVVGVRALVIISRSTAIFDSKVTVTPGTLGVGKAPLLS